MRSSRRHQDTSAKGTTRQPQSHRSGPNRHRDTGTKPPEWTQGTETQVQSHLSGPKPPRHRCKATSIDIRHRNTGMKPPEPRHTHKATEVEPRHQDTGAAETSTETQVQSRRSRPKDTGTRHALQRKTAETATRSPVIKHRLGQPTKI